MSLNDKGICPQEAAPQSGTPLGVVRDKEILARMILSPYHVEGGVIKNSILTVKDLQKSDGWSFVRKSRAGDSRMRVIGENISNQYVGYVTFKASAARKILGNNGKQALCIIDDAKKDFEEHALAKESERCPGAKESERRPGAEIREIRDELVSIFSSIHS